MRAVPTFDELVATIKEALRTEGFYVAEFDARAEDEIKLLRSAGRRAGRDLGWKIRTLAHGPHHDRQTLDVHVVVDEDVPELAAKRRAQMREAINAIPYDPPRRD